MSDVRLEKEMSDTIKILITAAQKEGMIEAHKWMSGLANEQLEACIKVLVEKYGADETMIDSEWIYYGLLGGSIWEAAQGKPIEFDAETYIDDTLKMFYPLVGWHKYGVDRDKYLEVHHSLPVLDDVFSNDSLINEEEEEEFLAGLSV